MKPKKSAALSTDSSTEPVRELHEALNDGDSDRIAEAVRIAEETTSSEIIVRLSAAATEGPLKDIARAEFERLGLARLPDQNGVLIYVSLQRRGVEIVIGTRAGDEMPERPWRTAVELIAEGFRNKTAADGIIAAVAAIAPELASHFPPSTVPGVELPNVSEDS